MTHGRMAKMSDLTAERAATSTNKEGCTLRVHNVYPDWSRCWTAEEIERELAPFKFDGPGWYITAQDTILIYPAAGTTDPWAHTTAGYFYVLRWGSSPEHRISEERHEIEYAELVAALEDLVNAIANAPVRRDEREGRGCV